MGRHNQLVAATALLVLAGACSSPATAPPVAGRPIEIVAGENQYGDVAAQIGGQFVRVYAVDSNPNTDPHSYEVTAGVARKVAAANLLVENGVGYDDFVGKLASASPSSSRRVINVQRLLGLPDSTANPHLWYDPATMPAVSKALASDLSVIDPAHASTFEANAAAFLASLEPWRDAIAAFKAAHAGTAAATTEPVADYLLDAMGIDNLTPFRFQADVMNGTDPSPQDVGLVEGFFPSHRVKVFCYNEQVTSAVTDAVRRAATKAGVPTVGVYETMPAGYHYQSWMVATVAAIQKAVATGAPTAHL